MKRPFGSGPTTLLSGLTITMVINHVSESWGPILQAALEVLYSDEGLEPSNEPTRRSKAILRAYENHWFPLIRPLLNHYLFPRGVC